jgi:DnaJ-class molecular chaperone
MVRNYFGMLGFNIEHIDELLNENWNERLKQRYREILLEIHPDKMSSSENAQSYATKLTQEANEAYAVLSSREQRNHYFIQIVQAANAGEKFEKTEIEKVWNIAKKVKNFA